MTTDTGETDFLKKHPAGSLEFVHHFDVGTLISNAGDCTESEIARIRML